MTCDKTPQYPSPCGLCPERWPVPAGSEYGEPVADGGKWEGAEEWMPLAWELCANECGEEACMSLVWEGGPIPEPWGERWLKYEDQAKEMIATVRRLVPSPAASVPAQAGGVAVPEGYKLVPVEPTKAMIDAGRWSEYGEETSRLHEVDDDDVEAVWHRMMTAAPSPAPAPAATTQQAEPQAAADGDLIAAAKRVSWKFGHDEAGVPSDWSEWVDLRAEIAAAEAAPAPAQQLSEAEIDALAADVRGCFGRGIADFNAGVDAMADRVRAAMQGSK